MNPQSQKNEKVELPEITSAIRETLDLAIAVKAYPNPFEDHMKFQFNLSKKQNVDISFTNQLGRLVYSESFQCPQGSNKIDLNTLFDSGLYIIKVQSDNGELNDTRKMIKK